MPFDDQKYYGPATRGQIGGVALHSMMALGKVADALEAIKAGDVAAADEAISKIRQRVSELDKLFDDLTGWISK